MTDLAALKSNYPLDTVIPNLKKIGPRFWAGPCPFCGGNDRFVLKSADQGFIWCCRSCSPDGRAGKKYQDPVEYIARLHSLPLHGSPAERYQAMQEIARIMGGTLDGQRSAPRPEPIPAPMPAPAADWQTAAYEIMLRTEQDLYTVRGQRALNWLTGEERRLTGASLKTWNIGYSTGFDHGGIWVPRGIVIPCFEYGDIWYLKIRLVPGDTFRCQGCKKDSTQPGRCECGKVNKYRGVAGNKPGLFGAGTLNGSNTAIVCEGEFDAMQLWSAVNQLPAPWCNRTAVITTGASSHFIDPVTWGIFGNAALMGINKFICIFDQDEAGEKAYQHMQSITPRAVRAHLPEMQNAKIKDATDYVRAGGNLVAWLEYQMEMNQ